MVSHILVKVSDVCNLACTYCQYYELANYERRTRHMSLDTVKALYQRVAEHLTRFPQPAFKFIWHGGEPMATGVSRFQSILALQTGVFPPETKIENSLHTNATLVNDRWLELLRQYSVRVSVSIDGPQEVNDLHRLTKAGASSFARTLRGFTRLQEAGFAPAILCVLQGNIAGGKLYEFLTRDLKAEKLDILLPLGSHASPTLDMATKEAIATQAIGVFDAWFSDPQGHHYTIRWFKEALRNMMGGCARLCTMQQKCDGILTIATNGDIFLCEDLSVAGPVFDTGCCIQKSSIEEAQTGWFKEIHLEGLELPTPCQSCEVQQICKGGCPATRFTTVGGFSMPSHHCEIFLKVYGHIAKRASATLTGAIAF